MSSRSDFVLVFWSAALGGAAVLMALYGVLLIIDPAETRHYEYAIPALLLGLVSTTASILLWRRASRSRRPGAHSARDG
jgi:hypothetical protein